MLSEHGCQIQSNNRGSSGSNFQTGLTAPGEASREEPGTAVLTAANGKRRVLVVDDNEAAARMLGVIVGRLGIEVRTAHDGQAAIEAAALFLPDVMLMDIGMPGMDGYDAAREIRRQPWSQGLIMIALTGWGEDEDKEHAKQAGFDHHFVKPIDLAALERLLAEPNLEPKAETAPK